MSLYTKIQSGLYSKNTGVALLLGLVLFVLFVGIGSTDNSVSAIAINSLIQSHPYYESVSSGQVTEQELLDNPQEYLDYFLRVILVMSGFAILLFIILFFTQTLFWNYVQTQKFSLRYLSKHFFVQLIFLFFLIIGVFLIIGSIPIIEGIIGLLVSLQLPTILLILAQLFFMVLLYIPIFLIFHVFQIQVPMYVAKYHSVKKAFQKQFSRNFFQKWYIRLLPYAIGIISFIGFSAVTISLLELHEFVSIFFGIFATVIPFAWLYALTPVVENYIEK